MPKDTQRPEDECPVEEESAEAQSAEKEPDQEQSAEPEPIPEASALAEEETPPKPKPVRIPHPLWRGWWLAVVLLGCFVLMGWTPGVGLTWLRQPMRAFGGAILAGGSLGALPSFLKGRKPEKPSWRRCLLAVLAGFAWGVLA